MLIELVWAKVQAALYRDEVHQELPPYWEGAKNDLLTTGVLEQGNFFCIIVSKVVLAATHALSFDLHFFDLESQDQSLSL